MGTYNKNVEIEVTAKNTQNGDGKILSYYGFKSSNELDDIVNRLADVNGKFIKPKPEKNIAMIKTTSSSLILKVLNDKIQDFLQTGFKSILSALVVSKKYDTDMLMHLYDQTEFALTSSMSKEEMDKLYGETQMSVVDMWTQYLNKINDPEIRQQLELYSKIFGNTVYGHALSLRNVMSVRAADSKYGTKATFVLGKSTWAEFGRGVKAGAKPYPLWRFTQPKNASASDIAKAQATLGHGLEQFGELGVAVQNAIKIEAQKEANKNVTKIPVRYIGYDISDTYLYKNTEDLLNTKPNISSNIVYTLNALAQEAEAKKNQGKDGVDKAENQKMLERTNLALAAVEKMCKNNGINTDNGSADPEAKLSDLLLQYFTKRITENKKTFDILKPENAQKYAEDGVQLTLVMTNVALNQLSRFRHSLQYTQKEAATLAPIIRYAVQTIGNATVNKVFESKLLKEDFIKDYKRALKQIGIKIVPNNVEQENVPENNITLESIKRSFFNTLDRLNNPINY